MIVLDAEFNSLSDGTGLNSDHRWKAKVFFKVLNITPNRKENLVLILSTICVNSENSSINFENGSIRCKI
jgi:hypothetical protein